MSDASAERIGRYRVVRRLATGGMAEIFLAHHDGPHGFHKLVVVKRVKMGVGPADGFKGMFIDEGRLSARLSHPNIAQAFELGEQDGRDFIAMEYVEGESLERLVKRSRRLQRPLPAAAVLRVVTMVLEALEYTHDLESEKGEWLKIVHRDVSASNVVVTYHGSVKLLDFGIARAEINEHHTGAGQVKGKGGYMSPEQTTGKSIDLRTDIYAVGSLLYYLATGEGPFENEASVFDMMKATVAGRFLPPRAINPEVPVELEKIILKAMALAPANRFGSAGDMLDALEQYALANGLFPAARTLASLMRQTFPERVGLARSWELTPSAALMDKIVESFVAPDDAALGGGPDEPTRPGRGIALEPGKAPEPLPPLVRPVPSPEPARSPPVLVPLPIASPQPVVASAPAAPPSTGFTFDDDSPQEDPTIQVNNPKRLLTPAEPARPPAEARTVSIEPLPKAASAPTQSEEPTRISLVRKRPITIVTGVADSASSHPWSFAAVGAIAVALGLLLLKLAGS